MIELVGPHEAADIRKQVDRILKDLGNPEPPLNLDLVRELLRLDREFYSAANVSFTQEIAHRVKVAGKQIVARPTLLIDVIRKANLKGLWIPDSKRILIDKDVPSAKHRWIEAHEIGHSITPWHDDFMHGDNEMTLDAQCRETIEAEANYAASRLLFLQDRFRDEARDMSPGFDSINALKKRYANTLTSTFWRFVEDRDPELATFGIIGMHPHHPGIGQGPNGEAYRYFIRSKRFSEQLGNISPSDATALVALNAGWKKTGPVGNGVYEIADVNGERFEIYLESFSNSYDLLTLGVVQQPITVQTESAAVALTEP